MVCKRHMRSLARAFFQGSRCQDLSIGLFPKTNSFIQLDQLQPLSPPDTINITPLPAPLSDLSDISTVDDSHQPAQRYKLDSTSAKERNSTKGKAPDALLIPRLTRRSGRTYSNTNRNNQKLSIESGVIGPERDIGTTCSDRQRIKETYVQKSYSRRAETRTLETISLLRKKETIASIFHHSSHRLLARTICQRLSSLLPSHHLHTL